MPGSFYFLTKRVLSVYQQKQILVILNTDKFTIWIFILTTSGLPPHFTTVLLHYSRYLNLLPD